MSARHVAVIVSLLLAFAVGWWGRSVFEPAPEPTGLAGAPAGRTDGPCPGGAAPLYWKAPMDPSYVSDAPGKSPMGMDLIPHCATGTTAEGAGIVAIDPVTIQNMGVRTTRVERRDLTRSIRAVGRITYDERRVTHVHTKVQGWAETLFADYVGQKVERGQRLLELYSPQLVATQEELLLAARYRTATEGSPFADVRGGGQSLLDATRRRLELWDIPDRDIDRLLDTAEIQKTLTLYAPSSGVITRLGVRSGMEVKPNDNLYTIADLSRVWAVADVYEFELAWIEVGQEGTVELSYLPGAAITGRVTYVAPFLDPETRTAEVRLELPNPDGRLKPEMFGNILIRGVTRRGVIAVPAEAVIRSGRRALVVLARGEGRFEPREIELGMDSGDGWLEVRSGLAAGDEIALSSQFLIDSESKLQEAIEKLGVGRREPPSSPAEVERATPGAHDRPEQ